MNAEEQYRAASESIAAFVAERTVLRVTGPEATTYLQGQLSQDVAALSHGGTAWALLLAPAGKVDALLRVTRVAEEEYLLDTDAGFTEPVLARLTRFKLRTKVDIDALDWRMVAVRGPKAVAPSSAGAAGESVVVASAWEPFAATRSEPAGAGSEGAARGAGAGSVPTAARGYDILGPSPKPPSEATPLDQSVYEALRVELGVPAMGHELTEKTIPAEAGIVSTTVSFTKGCYTGQELVARIDSRGGNVARHLRGLRFSESAPTAGAELSANGKKVGWVTSLAESPRLGAIGLGYVGRAVTPPAEVEADGAGVQVVELPF